MSVYGITQKLSSGMKITAMKTATVYIDGFNLYYGMVKKGWGKYKWLDLRAFAEKIIPSDYALGCVWYFTSWIKGNVQKYERQQRYVNALKARGNIKIEYGNYQMFDTHCKHCGCKPVFCGHCGNEYTKPTEKKTDVNLSTFMLTDCIEKLTDCVVLVSGDSDYDAPLTQIKRLFPLVHRVVAYPPRRKNSALEKFTDSQCDIDEAVFAGSLLPNPVKSELTGKKYFKPTDWI